MTSKKKLNRHLLKGATARLEPGSFPRARRIAPTELYYIYLEIGLLYFRQSKTCGQKPLSFKITEGAARRKQVAPKTWRILTPLP